MSNNDDSNIVYLGNVRESKRIKESLRNKTHTDNKALKVSAIDLKNLRLSCTFKKDTHTVYAVSCTSDKEYIAGTLEVMRPYGINGRYIINLHAILGSTKHLASIPYTKVFVVEDLSQVTRKLKKHLSALLGN